MEKKVQYSVRKWFGVIWLLIEVNLIGGTIFGFPALFRILPQYGIYGDKDKESFGNHVITFLAILDPLPPLRGEPYLGERKTKYFMNTIT